MNNKVTVRKTSGFSLVELMVALLIGLIIILGAGQLFLMGKRSYERVGELSFRQESLRFITDMVSRDIRSASEVDGSGAVLELEYLDEQRELDDYCSEDYPDLTKVLYEYEGGELWLTTTCGDDVGEEVSDRQSLIKSLDDMVFDPGPGMYYLKIYLEFEGMQGEPAGANSFDFVVAMRSKAF